VAAAARALYPYFGVAEGHGVSKPTISLRGGKMDESLNPCRAAGPMGAAPPAPHRAARPVLSETTYSALPPVEAAAPLAFSPGRMHA